jgi:hypothetical protein
VRAPARSAAVVASWLLALGLCAGFVFVAVSAGTNLGDVSSALVGITFSTVGVVIASKRPENRVGLIFLGIGLSLSLNAFAFTGADYVRVTSGSPLWHWLAWVGTWSWQPGFVLGSAPRPARPRLAQARAGGGGGFHHAAQSGVGLDEATGRGPMRTGIGAPKRYEISPSGASRNDSETFEA